MKGVEGKELKDFQRFEMKGFAIGRNCQEKDLFGNVKIRGGG